MRILIAHSRYLSGSASGENRVVEDEARLLAAAGHHVRVWDPSPEAATPVARLRRGKDAVWSARAASEMRRAVGAGRCDIVHGHNLFPTLSPAVIRAATGEGVPVVMTLHNYRLVCLPATLLRDGGICEDCVGRAPWPGVVHRCFRRSFLGSGALALSLGLHRRIGSFDRVTLYLAVGAFVRDKHVQAGMPADRIRVKSNFAAASERREGPGSYYLFLGRLAPEKGVRTLIDAWGRNAPEELLIVGDGPDAGALRDASAGGVRFLGQRPSTEVPELIRRARALLLPSRWYEGQPRVVLEAYAAGVPVIASRIGGLAEVVEHDVTGLLVDPSDGSAWAEAVDVLADDATSERLGQGAFARWADRFTPEQALTDLEAAYEDALGRVTA